MILQCPSCFAKYFIDDNISKNPNSKFRCSKCSYTWKVEHEIENVAVEEGNTVIDKRSFAESNKTFKVKKTITTEKKIKNLDYIYNSVFRHLTTVVLFCIFLFFIISVMFVCNFLPNNIYTKIYNTLPFKVANVIDTSDIFFDGLGIESIQYKSQYNVIVRGFIVNKGQKTKVIPPVRICLDNVYNKCIRSYYIKSTGKAINPNSRENFYYNIVDVAKEADRVVIDMGSKIELFLR